MTTTVRFDEVYQRAKDAGFVVFMFDNQVSVHEAGYHMTTPHDCICFENIGGYAHPFYGTSIKFNREVLKAIGARRY